MFKKLLTSAALLSAIGLTACSFQGKSTSQTQFDKIKEVGVLKVATPGTLFPTRTITTIRSLSVTKSI